MSVEKYHPVVGQIKSLLNKNDCWYETFEHRAVRTSEEAAEIRTGYTIEQGAKALILYSNDLGEFIMLVLPADQRFDNNKVRSLLEVSHLRFARPDEVREVTNGVLVGGVPPFGNLFDLEVITDPSLLGNEKIIFNAGDRRYSIAIKSADYKKLVNPQIAQII
jgi:prolyl-tRNA editing enzyme YbaK/EbsC (Cys-tRNA(Pro) deacylase)